MRRNIIRQLFYYLFAATWRNKDVHIIRSQQRPKASFAGVVSHTRRKTIASRHRFQYDAFVQRRADLSSYKFYSRRRCLMASSSAVIRSPEEDIPVEIYFTVYTCACQVVRAQVKRYGSHVRIKCTNV